MHKIIGGVEKNILGFTYTQGTASIPARRFITLPSGMVVVPYSS